MIAFVRVASVRPGQQAVAMAFAMEVSTFLKNSYDLDFEVLRPVGGNPYRIAWSTRYADLASMETITNKMVADPKYLALLKGASDLFIAGATRDDIWQTT